MLEKPSALRLDASGFTAGISVSAGVEQDQDMGTKNDPVTPQTASIALGPLEQQLALEKYKSDLDYKKFKLGSVAVAITLATIPPSFQLATAFLEKSKANYQILIDQKNKESESTLKQNEFRAQYVKEFLDKALSQDIEYRIRFAEYFASVAADSHRSSWQDYLVVLEKKRDNVRLLINAKEAEWQSQAGSGRKDQTRIDALERELTWHYKEVGYIEGNRSVSTDPRNPQTISSFINTDFSFRNNNINSNNLNYNINYSKFTEIIAEKFLIKPNLQQINVIHSILNYWNEKYGSFDIRILAYIFATIYHETNGSFIPQEEFEKGRKYAYSIPDPDTGHSYYGRGLIQLTWSQNYRKVSAVVGIDIFNNPNLVLDPKISTSIAIEIMMRGLLTGRKISDYLSSDKFDALNARRTVNGLDRAELISNHYVIFLNALQSSTE